MGISYRAMQYILCLYAMKEDPACDMPAEEKFFREEEIKKVRTEKAAATLQAIYRGQKFRRLLGVNKGAAKSEAESQAASFKKRFVGLMNNPGAMGTPPKKAPGAVAVPTMAVASANPPRPAVPAALAVPAAPTTVAGSSAVGVPMGSPPPAATGDTTQQQAAATAEVRNVFRERAAQRAAAKAAKPGAK